MLSRRGWGLLGGAAALVVGGRAFGLVELYMLAAGVVALAVACLAWVSMRRVSVGVSRSLHPPRVHAGSASRVELELENTGWRRTPVLSVEDSFDDGWRWARFLVPPLAPGERTRAAYRLPTDERGIFDIGPLAVAVTDPFGIASSRSLAAGVTQLTVYPRVDRVSPLIASGGDDPHSGSNRPRALLGTGDEFYALRQYEVGDDTRRVHWPSTARLGELMIRQDEMPWQTRTTILLDVRDRAHDADSLEIAVSAAASVHEACRSRRELVRLVSTDGTDSAFAAGNAHAQAILEHLATVDASGDDRLAGATAALRRAGSGGGLVVVTTDRFSERDGRAFASLRARFNPVVVVVVATSTGTATDVPGATAVVHVARAGAFADAWERAIGRAPAGRR